MLPILGLMPLLGWGYWDEALEGDHLSSPLRTAPPLHGQLFVHRSFSTSARCRFAHHRSYTLVYIVHFGFLYVLSVSGALAPCYLIIRENI